MRPAPAKGQKLLPRWATSAISKDEMVAPDVPRSQTVVIPVKTVNDSDRLAACNPFFQQGTHRAQYGETLLHKGRIFDKAAQDELQKRGKNWV